VSGQCCGLATRRRGRRVAATREPHIVWCDVVRAVQEPGSGDGTVYCFVNEVIPSTRGFSSSSCSLPLPWLISGEQVEKMAENEHKVY
jgi:hypothetical protein